MKLSVATQATLGMSSSVSLGFIRELCQIAGYDCEFKNGKFRLKKGKTVREVERTYFDIIDWSYIYDEKNLTITLHANLKSNLNEIFGISPEKFDLLMKKHQFKNKVIKLAKPLVKLPSTTEEVILGFEVEKIYEEDIRRYNTQKLIEKVILIILVIAALFIVLMLLFL